jgi:hypothetical protein
MMTSAVWQSRAHAAAVAADPLYPEFVQRRQSLATTPVRDHHVAMSGTPPLLCVEARITGVNTYKTLDTQGHEAVLCVTGRVHSLRPPGFTGSCSAVSDEDHTVGIYLSGWNSIEVRRDPEPSPLHGN